MVRVTVVPVDERPRREDIEEGVLARNPERAVEGGSVRQQDGVVVLSEGVERYGCREGRRMRVGYADGSVRTGRDGSCDLDVAEEPEPRIPSRLFKLVFAILFKRRGPVNILLARLRNCAARVGASGLALTSG